LGGAVWLLTPGGLVTPTAASDTPKVVY